MNNRYCKPKNRHYQDWLIDLFPEFTKLNKKVSQITLQVTEDCCLACTYCYQHHKTENIMTFDIAKKFIDNLLTDEYELINTSNTCGICVDFIGGEPFLQIDLIDKICEYIITQLIVLKHPWRDYITFDFCSNGILIETQKVKNFLQKYQGYWHLSISIDGNKELHDACRIDFNNQGSYDRAISAVNYIKNTYGNIPNTKMTFAPENISYTSKALINLIKLGYEEIPANCIFEKGWTEEHATIFYNELKKVADYILNNNLYNKVCLFLFDEEIGKPNLENDNKNWCGGIADHSLAIDYKGDFYPCIRYMNSSLNGRQEPLVLGNVYTNYLDTDDAKRHYKMLSNITRRSQSTDECFYCPIAEGCGWCSGYNYEETGSPNKRVTYICIMHKARVLANIYYWNKLYSKLKMNKVKINYLQEKDCLKIISHEEYNYLQKLQLRRDI